MKKHLLVLGIKKQQNEYDYAVVDSGNKLVDSGKILQNKFLGELKKILNKYKVKLVAYSAEDAEEYLEIKLPSVQVPWELAANYQIDVDTNEQALYPAILLVDKNDSSSVHIFSDAEKQKPIAEHKDQSLAELIKEFESILEIASIKNHALQGDLNTYNLQADFSKKANNFDFRYLAKLLTQKKEEFDANEISGMTSEVQAELLKYFKFDISASILQLLYEQIIYYLMTLASELEIHNLRVIGNIAEDVGFRALFTQISETNGYRVNFADKNLNPAVGLAAAGYHLSYF